MIDANLMRSVLRASTLVWLLGSASVAMADANSGAAGASASGVVTPPAKHGLPPDVAQCSSAVDRMALGPKYAGFVWDHDDPRKYIHSTLMPSTEFRGKMVPVDYTLILVGQLRQRPTGQLVEANGVCGVREGRIISVRVAPSEPHT